jgi:hypothetical protein
MTQSIYARMKPERRPLRIFAFDPMPGRAPDQSLWRASDNRITIDVVNEDNLKPGPQGSRIEVIDYDAPNGCYYTPVDLNDQALLMQDGLEPSESDPRFHQQMVYAVAMKVLENFDAALGRKLRFRRQFKNKRQRIQFENTQLRIFPHAFHGANAFYDSEQVALFFGYFQASRENPGPNLPGQTVFTCLSHDIIAHEMTHSLVDRLRRYFREPSNVDVPAFHEGFSDIVAIFQHFTFPDILRRLIQETQTKLRESEALIQLARQFGYATGKGSGLRSAVESKPDARLYQTALEPHERGSVLVAAVFDAFFMTYQRRIKDLVRIATGGTGRLPEGDLHPDLVNRIAQEASHAAQSILSMCIRAFEYLPPVDITFGDYLRALVTTDIEISPSDELCERAAMIEGFRVRGIYPDNVTSLAEESLLWERVEERWEFSPYLDKWTKDMIIADAQAFTRNGPPPQYYFPASDFRQWATKNARRLNLDPSLPIEALGFHPSFRVGAQGQLIVERVMQFAQVDPDSMTDEDFGGIPFRGGTTVIASADNEIRYIISKPLPFKGLSPEMRQRAEERREKQKKFVAQSDAFDPSLTWYDKNNYRSRMVKRMDFAAMHRNIKP